MSEQAFLRKWTFQALLGLMLVAAVGVMLRYKIAFPMHWVDQRHLLHAHSHFAFAGWISMALMPLLIAAIARQGAVNIFPRYRWILRTALFSAYGMLVSFSLQGYGTVSISFSTLNIGASYWFCIQLWRDMRHVVHGELFPRFLKVALICNAISSLGAFALAFLMANRIIDQNAYLASIYFFLHFQYNGWFIFSILGLLFEKLARLGIREPGFKGIYRLFMLAVGPAYFLSALWMKIPVAVYVLVVIAALIQCIAWAWLVHLLRKNRPWLIPGQPAIGKWLISLCALAFTIKLLLQAASTIPSLSTLAFGFRPIVIGYLHLVLLGVITLFLLGYFFGDGIIKDHPLLKWGAGIFSVAVILNECALMLQGVYALNYVSLPYWNEVLFGSAVLLLLGSGILVYGSIRPRKHLNPVD